jgi:hypothetical protein
LILRSIGELISEKCAGESELICVNRGLEHSAAPEEIDDVEKYLNERIPALGDKPTL